MSNYIVEIAGFGINKKIPSKFKNASSIFQYIYIGSFFIVFTLISVFSPESVWRIGIPYTIFSVLSVCFSSIFSFLFLSFSCNLAVSGKSSTFKFGMKNQPPDATSTIHLGLILVCGFAMILTAFCIDKLSIS